MFNTLEFRTLRPIIPSLSDTTPNPTNQYIKFKEHNTTTQNAMRQRYTNSQLFLGVNITGTLRVSVCRQKSDFYG